jgi:hypothetical protein
MHFPFNYISSPDDFPDVHRARLKQYALLRAKVWQDQKTMGSIEKVIRESSWAASSEGGNSVVKEREVEVRDLEFHGTVMRGWVQWY